MSPAGRQLVPIGPRRAARQLRERVAAVEAHLFATAASPAVRVTPAAQRVLAAWGTREREIWGPLAVRAVAGEAVAELAPLPLNDDGAADADRDPAELVVRFRHLRALALVAVDAAVAATTPPPPALGDLLVVWCADDAAWWAQLLVSGGEPGPAS